MSETIDRDRAELQQACWRAIAELDAKRPDKAEDILLKAMGDVIKIREATIERLKREAEFLNRRIAIATGKAKKWHFGKSNTKPKERVSHEAGDEAGRQEAESHTATEGA